MRTRVEAIAAQSVVGRLGLRTAEALVQVELFDRSMTLAAQAFTSVVPIIIAAAALQGGDAQPVGQNLATHLGLSHSAKSVLESAVPPASDVFSALGWFGILVLIVSATALSRALERFYIRVWSARKAGLRFAWRWLAAVAAVVIGVLLVQFTRSVIEPRSGFGAFGFVLEVVIWAAVWLITPWVVLNRTVSFRMLLPGAVLAGIALAIMGLVGRVYLPIALSAAAAQFGVLGITFSYIGWLFVLMFVLVAATTIGQVLVTDDGATGRILRGEKRPIAP
ncbi:hypothetical protein WJX64_14210 [Leifsonia sp. YIM 134122]|uniref:Uncharacterized protein n=1 Tax=Leifsonia stereocauli TaxID=3134136 RepID=A0ABU9W6W0_9MICO